MHQSRNILDYFVIHALFSEMLQILQALRDKGATALATSLSSLSPTSSHLQSERTLSRSVAYSIGNVMLSIERL